MPERTFRRQPFIYGRPVRPKYFLGREDELRTIFNRLYNRESTAVVGEPHIGKSSLILKLEDETTHAEFFGPEANDFLFSSIDLHAVSNDYTPEAFWKEATERLDDLEDEQVLKRLKRAKKDGFRRRSLERLFDSLEKSGKCLVLLLDEFERLIAHPKFNSPEFFALLRSLATRTGSLALVTATRLSIAQMNTRGKELLETGSPFFNNMIEVNLNPFEDAQIDTLLDFGGFSEDDAKFIRRIAGRQPFLLQAMGAAMFEAAGAERHEKAAEKFFESISFHFDDLWSTLDDNTRTTSVILSLLELGGRAFGNDFNYGEIERADRFAPELHKLAKRGLAEQVWEGKGWKFDTKHLLVWRDEKWTVGAQAFAWWVRDTAIAESRKIPTYNEWLQAKRYKFLLTEEQWQKLGDSITKAPEWAVKGVRGLAKALFEELVNR